MAHKKVILTTLVSAMIISAAAPVFAQGVLDRMKEDAQRRAENKAAMDAENPAPAKKIDTTAAPATTSAPAQDQSASAVPATTPAPTAPASPAPDQSASAAPSTPAPTR